MQMVLTRLQKIHPDYFIEFERDVEKALDFVWSYAPTKAVAEAEGLVRVWRS